MIVAEAVGLIPKAYTKLKNKLLKKKNKTAVKGKRYPLLIVNTDRSDKEGNHWWSILDIDGKKGFLLFDSFGIKGLKNFIVQDDQKIVGKVLKGVENLKKEKEQINLVSVNFVKDSYLKLSEGE